MKMGPSAMKLLRFAHLGLVILFVGGVVAATVLAFSIDVSSYPSALAGTSAMRTIFNDVVRIGSVGTVLVGLCYGFFTKWGFIRYRWLLLKWIILVAQVGAGILIIDRTIQANVSLVAQLGANVVRSPQLLSNIAILKVVLVVQVVASFTAIAVANWRLGTGLRHREAPPTSQSS